jgi:ribonuclease Z
MSDRKFIALGTASQVPTRERNHNGYFLAWDNEGLLFDPGEGTQRQMIYAGVSVSQITKILITHLHGDHCLGLPGIIQRISLDNVPHTVELYYPASGQQYIDNLKQASLFYNVAKIKDCPISKPGLVFEGRNFTIEAQPLDHSVESWGYRVEEADSVSMQPEKLAQLGISGADIGRLKQQGSIQLGDRVVDIDEVSAPRKGQSFAFVMDTRVCESAYLLARNADMLVCESTYLDAETEDAAAHGHLTATQAAEITHRAKANQLVLTHFSQRYATTEEFVTEAQRVHPKVIAARDGDHIELPRRIRELSS